MNADRVAELLAPFLASTSASNREPASLAPSQLNNISMYVDMLLRWNSRINLTAVRRPEEIVTRHFGESLFAARHLLLAEEQGSAPPYVIDIGSGAGFPGLPMKVWAPHIRLTLIESNHKKATFLREVIRALTLTDVDVFSGRAEDFPIPTSQTNSQPSAALARPGADVVTLRAVEQFEAILPTAARLLAPTAKLGLLIGDSQSSRAQELLPPITWNDPRPIPLSNSRVLLIGYPKSGPLEPNQ